MLFQEVILLAFFKSIALCVYYQHTQTFWTINFNRRTKFGGTTGNRKKHLIMIDSFKSCRILTGNMEASYIPEKLFSRFLPNF